MFKRHHTTILLILFTVVLIVPLMVPHFAHAEPETSDTVHENAVALQQSNFSVLSWVSGGITSGLQVMGNWAIWLFGLLLWIAGRFFDITIYFSVVKFSEFATMTAIVSAWATARDFANVFFIFILLYIAIGTILRLNGIDTQRMVVKVVIIALLINFSRVLTGVVIDSGNVISYQFYKALREGDTSQTFNQDHSISQTFVQALSIQESLREPDSATLSASGIDPTGGVGVGPLSVITHTLGSVIFIITASFIFFAAAILLMFRLVALLFVIILSPLAFLAYAFPTQERHFNNWLDSLIKQTFFAPAYLFNLYLVAKIVKSNGISDLANVAAGAGSGLQVINIIVNFIIIIMLLGGCILIATKMGAAGASTVAGWQKKLTGKARGYAGEKTVGFVARNTIGRLGRSVNEGRIGSGFKALEKTNLGAGLGRGVRNLGKKAQDVDFGFKGASLNAVNEARLKKSNIDDYKGDAVSQAKILRNLSPEARLSYYRKLEAKDRASLEASTINDPKLEAIFKELREKRLTNPKELKDTNKALETAKAERDVADGLKSLKEGIVPSIGSDGKVERNLSTGKIIEAEKEKEDEQLKKFITLIKPNKDNAGALAEALKFGGTEDEKIRSTKIVQSLSKNQLKSLLKDDSLDAMKDVDGTIKGISESLSALPADDELKQYAAAAPFAALVGLKGLKEKGAEQQINTLKKTEAELRAESEKDPVLLQLKEDLHMHRGNETELIQKIAARPDEFIQEKQKEALDALSIDNMHQVAPLLSITSPADKKRTEFILQNISQAKARKLGENFTENQKELLNREYRGENVGAQNPALARQLNELGVEYADRPAQAASTGGGGEKSGPAIIINTGRGGEAAPTGPKIVQPTGPELRGTSGPNAQTYPTRESEEEKERIARSTSDKKQAEKEAYTEKDQRATRAPAGEEAMRYVPPQPQQPNPAPQNRPFGPFRNERPSVPQAPSTTTGGGVDTSSVRNEIQSINLNTVGAVPKQAPKTEEEEAAAREALAQGIKEAESGKLTTEKAAEEASVKNLETPTSENPDNLSLPPTPNT